MNSAVNSPANSLGLLDRDEAALLLGVSVKTLRRFVREGLLRPVRYSRTSRLRFREADLRQFIENRAAGPRPPARCNDMKAAPILRRDRLPAVAEAIRRAVNRRGHPDSLWCGTEQSGMANDLVDEGLTPAEADVCGAVLTSFVPPSDPGQAVAAWMRRLGEVAA